MATTTFSAGSSESMLWLETELAKAYEIQTQKLGGIGDAKSEGKVLNRILRCTDGGWEIEADPRHAELVIEQPGLGDDKGIGTPGVCRASMRTTRRRIHHWSARISQGSGELLQGATTSEQIDQMRYSPSKKAAVK